MGGVVSSQIRGEWKVDPNIDQGIPPNEYADNIIDWYVDHSKDRSGKKDCEERIRDNLTKEGYHIPYIVLVISALESFINQP